MIVEANYSQRMARGDAFIEVRLCLDDPIEISDFAALFAGLGAEFERHLAAQHPDARGAARMYVKEVRKGSVIATLFADIPDLIGLMDDALIVLGFGAIFNKRIRDFIGGKKLEGAKKTQLNDIMKTIRAVAQDKSGSMAFKGVRFKEGVFSTEFEAVFTASEAREAAMTIENQKRDLDRISTADHTRVLMRFKRSDVGNAQIGKRSGEQVVIEEVSGRPMALIYGSELAEAAIKYEIQNSPDNVYKRGFVVDANTVFTGAKPVAYSVIHLHSVIDLEP